MNASSEFPLSGRAALESVASPARLELLSALRDEPLGTAELAARLGRSRQALYYHLGLLERAGLVVAEPPAEGERERRYRIREGRLAIGARRDSPADRSAATKAIRAILRLTAREVTEALEDPGTRFRGPQREMIGFRGKARLTGRQLRRVNELIDELEALFRDAKGDSASLPLEAITVVLTPARNAGNLPSGVDEER
jgi:DNA-binding transcriptional ArsR family regulator